MTTAASPPPLLSMRRIAKDFPGVRALDGVSFDVQSGEIHALVGENGAGKSTLMKILGGVYPHSSFSGEIHFRGHPVRFRSTRDAEAAGITVVHQELALVKHMSVSENVFLGNEPGRFGFIDSARMHRRTEELMERLGLAIDVGMEVGSLGLGEQQLVEIAKALRRESRLLVLDEPTSALAENEVARLFDIMRELRSQGVALVYISHKLDEVFQIADRVTVLRDGKHILTRETERLSRDEIIHAMVGRELKEMFPRTTHAPGETILEVRDLNVDDPNVSGRRLLEDVSFHVRRGEILGIAGLMGAGRTELLSTIFGNPPGRWRGRIIVNGREVAIRSPRDAIKAGLGFVTEDRKQLGLVLGDSVLHNLSLVHLRDFCRAGFVNGRKEFEQCRSAFSSLDIRAPSLHVAAETLSGGNQQKVVLGKWLLRPPTVLFLDEPTRGVDVGAKVEIHSLMGELTERGMAIVMVSSELPELLGVCDRILVLREGRVAGEFSREEATQEKIMRLAT